jgi:hypothetical protein
MNMISTGAFLPETDASTKQSELVKKLTSAWEKKNSKKARAGGASLMALSLAACGGEDNTPFSAADVSAAEAAATTAALTAADGVTVYASVDAAVAAGEDAAESSMIAAINTALGTSLTTADDSATVISTIQTSNDAEVTAAADEAAAATAATVAEAAASELAAANEATATAEAATADLQTLYDALVASNATLQTAYDALVTPTSQALTTGVDAVAGTSGSDTFTAADGTIGAGDAIVDASSTDNDTLTITDTGVTLASMGTISNVENVILNAAANAAYTVTSAANVTNSAVTVNLTLPGGGTQVTVSDIGTQSSVIAGDRVATLNVDFGGTRGDMSVTGGTGALDVNTSAAAVDGLTVDGSNGTTTTVDFGADSSNVTITSGTGAVTVTGTGDVAGLTVDGSNVTGTAAMDIDYATDSSDVSVTTGDSTGAVAVGAAGIVVTGLTVDATNTGGTVGITTGTGSSGVSVTLGDDAGALTATGAGVAGDITVTSTQAIGNGVTQYETVTIAANSTTASTAATAAGYVADANVESLSASAAGSAQYMDAVLATSLATINMSGDNAITVSVDSDIFDTVATNTLPTITTSGAAHVIALGDAATVGLDLTGVSSVIDVEAAQTTTFELADNASLLMSAVMTAGLFDGVAANQTLTVDVDGNNFDASLQNIDTLNIVNDSTTSSTLVIEVDADDDGTDAGATINISGSGDVVVGGATAADAVNAAASTGNISATASATIDTITTGAGDDSVVAYAGDHTVVMGAGDDTYSIGVDISGSTVAVSGHEIVSLTGATTMTIAQANAILAGTTVDGTQTLAVNGTATADTVSFAGTTEGANALTSVTVDAGAGDDTITLSDEFTNVVAYTTGADGNDTIAGFTTGTDTYSTDFSVANGAAAVVTVTTAAARALNTTADDIFSFTVDSFSDTSEAGVIAAISNGSITVSTAADDGMILINDGTSSWLFEFTSAATDTTLTAVDDTITHVATFTDEVIVAADIV